MLWLFIECLDSSNPVSYPGFEAIVAKLFSQEQVL